MNTLYITGAGVSAESGIPTFRGVDGYWTIGSRNYTPMTMDTTLMHTTKQTEDLALYYPHVSISRDLCAHEIAHWPPCRKPCIT